MMKNDRSSTHSYQTYKDSEIEWLGDVPKHWELKRLKDVSKIIDCKNRTPEYFDDGEYLVIRTSNVRDGRINLDNPSFTDELNFVEWTKRGIPPVGSVLFTREAPAGEVCLVPEGYKPCLGQRMMNFIPKNSNYSLYLLYYFLSQKIISYLETITSGSTVHHLRIPQVFDISVIVPPLDEQKSIAHYLDTKTAQIDRKIDLLTQKATQYGNLKQSIVNESVTRGLDRSVVMKDSGIEWIGDVPEHWEVKRVKDIGLVVMGKMLNNKASDHTFYRHYLKSKNIGWLKVDVSSVEEMYFTPDEMKVCLLRKGDLVLSEGGEVGKTSIWEEELDECYIQNSVHKITVFKRNYSRYFLYQSFLLGSTKYYDSIVNYVSIKHLTKEKLIKIVWICPPLSEQKAIADYLDTKTTQIDQIIQTINTQIEKLKELRKTLINDVVTGKIRVIEDDPSSHQS
ncbi:MAG: restriction endonuclease subunit S [Cyanobacteria bacterium]|nr:restriction endonuclease subunit S [Cyanobacteriota bacterium]